MDRGEQGVRRRCAQDSRELFSQLVLVERVAPAGSRRVDDAAADRASCRTPDRSPRPRVDRCRSGGGSPLGPSRRGTAGTPGSTGRPSGCPRARARGARSWRPAGARRRAGRRAGSGRRSRPGNRSGRCRTGGPAPGRCGRAPIGPSRRGLPPRPDPALASPRGAPRRPPCRPALSRPGRGRSPTAIFAPRSRARGFQVSSRRVLPTPGSPLIRTVVARPCCGGIERLVERRKLCPSAHERRARDTNHPRIIGPARRALVPGLVVRR